MSTCPTCAPNAPCREGARIGGTVGWFLTTNGMRWGMSPDDVPMHSARVFAYGQAVHAHDQQLDVHPGVYITDDTILLRHATPLLRRFNLEPISKTEAERRGITHAHPACELDTDAGWVTV